MFTLDRVVPWGRSFDEYRRMFALSDRDLNLRILGCADGPASFNAEATRQGAVVVSCDPIYRYDADQLRDRIAATGDDILEQTRQNADEFVWDSIRSIDELGRIRMTAMNAFLDDYPAGKAQGRYRDARLPTLPFSNASFDLALCSHFLFLYTAQLGEAFHHAAIGEMCRVASEVRALPAPGARRHALTAGGCDDHRTRQTGSHGVNRQCPLRVSAWGPSDDADSSTLTQCLSGKRTSIDRSARLRL